MSRTKLLVFAVAGLAALSTIACGTGRGSVYVGVAGPGPWYGYPSPGMYPGGGVRVGVPVCCEDLDAMAEPAETTARYAVSEAARQGKPAQPEAASSDERSPGGDSGEPSRTDEDEGRQGG